MHYALLISLLSITAGYARADSEAIDSVFAEFGDDWSSIRASCEIASEVPADPRIGAQVWSLAEVDAIVEELGRLEPARAECAQSFLDMHARQLKLFSYAICGGPFRGMVYLRLKRTVDVYSTIQAAIDSCPRASRHIISP